MSVQYESTGFGDIRADGLHGRPGVGISELMFSLDWSIQPTRNKEVLSVFGTSAWIYVQPAGTDQALFLGQANPETAWTTETRDYANNSTLFYRLVLPNPQMLAIEEVRQGRELVFTIDVRGNSYGPRGVRSFDQKVTQRVTVSDWIRVLREANAADVLLVGIHMPAARVNGPLKSAVEIVRRANEHLILGHYSAAVAECRLAIESLWKAGDLGEKARESRKLLVNMEQQKSMTKRERELALGEALRIFCHTAHHVGHDAAPEVFGRLDAALAVGAAAAIISTLVVDPQLVAVGVSEDKSNPKAKKKSIPAATQASSATQEDRVSFVIEHFTLRPSNRPASLSALRSLLESLFRKTLNSIELDELMTELKTRGIILTNGKKLEYRLAPAES